MLLRHFAGALTRILLLVPLAAGARAECGAPGSHTGPVAEQEREPDCHQAQGPAHDAGSVLAAPSEHHGGGPLSGHCPAHHSCALELSFLVERGAGGRLDAGPAPAPSRAERFVSLAQLPEIPPPKA